MGQGIKIFGRLNQIWYIAKFNVSITFSKLENGLKTWSEILVDE